MHLMPDPDATATFATTTADAPRPLPDGWRWARLGDVCEAIRGITFSGGDAKREPFAESIACLTTSGVQAEVNWPSRCFIPSDRVSSEVQLLREHDLLVSTANSKALVGKTCHVGEPPFPCTFGAFVTVLRASSLADSRYLAYYLKSPPALDYCYRTSSNTTGISNLRVSDLLALLIPLSPLAEQRRIAAILAAHMAAVERARTAAEAQREAAKALPAAELRAVFESEEAQAWPRAWLGDVGQIVSGVTLGRKLGDQPTISIPYLRVANVKDGYLDLDDVYSVEATEGEVSKLQLQWGDVLLTEGGDPDKLGRGTYWRRELDDCIHQNHIFRVRFDLNTVSPQFISAQIGSPYGKAYFLSHAKQTTGIPTINQQVLRGFPLMLPTIEIQASIAAALDARMAEIARLRASLAAQLDTINALPAALLRQAFNGEL